MTPAHLLFSMICLLCGAVAHLASSPHQKSIFVTVNVGANLTLECPYDGQVSKYYWFKQSLGEIPRLMSTIFRGTDEGVFEDEFKNDMRFKMDTDGNKRNVNITNVQLSDSATYFCTKGHSVIFEFVRSITVFVKGSQLNFKAEVHQSPHEDTEPGRSVTLNCSVHTGTCDGPHRVYWFKQSEESVAGLLYSHGGSSDQCGRNTDSQTNSCVYNLPIHNVSSEQTGTYYCAVASCGQVLFGNGTKVDVKGEKNVKEIPPVLVYVLSGFSIILVVFLALSLYKKEHCRCRESQARLSHPSAANREGDQDADNLHYAALHINKTNPRSNSRNQRSTSRNDCVYSSVK